MAEEEVSHFNLTPTEFSLYYAYYHRITPPGEKLSGGRAREFFLQTGLSPPLLSAIWKQSDIDQDGCLSSAEFPLAMYLIQQSLRGIPLPLYLPQQLHGVYSQVVNPQLPVATDAHLGKCKKAFEAFRQNVGKGVLGGDAARYLLTKSNLTKGQLYHIWKLSDIDEDGHLTFKEFTVAMHLLFIAKLGYFLPVDLDPNTILSPSHHDVIRKVQAEAEGLPSVDPDHIPIRPFSPPTTPMKKAPFFGENPFTGDDFVNLPARRFREGEFGNFYGDPFESVETFSGPPLQPDATTVSDVGTGSTLQQFQVNTGSAESVSQESQESQVHSHSSGMDNGEPGSHSCGMDNREPGSHSSGIDNGEPESTEQHDYYVLEEPSITANQAHFSESITTSKHHDPELSSHESVNLSQTSSTTESESEKSSPNSRRSGQKMKKKKSSVESLQDVVVTEREEPVLQLAKPVDVIGSREVTPVPEEEPARWVSPGQVQAELEELSRASRKFLEESRSRLEEQQRRNLHVVNGGDAHPGFGMEELKAASRKGLSATIQEMQGAKGEVSEPEQMSEVLQEELASVRVEGDMMSHLDNLEAEVWAALEDAENLDATENSTTNTAKSVDVGGASPATGSTSVFQPTVEPKDSTVATGKLELKRTVSPLSSGKTIKVTSVQVNIRKSSRNEEPRRVQIQPQPVKQVTQDPIPVSEKSQPVAAQEAWEQDPQPVRLRRRREPVSKEVVNAPPVVKMEKTGSLSRKEARRSFIEEEIMVDIDSFLEGELASINEVLEQFSTEDKKAEKRNQDEMKLLESKDATEGAVLPEVSVEEISRRRQVESQNIEEQWEEEMRRLEEERLQALQREEELKKMIENNDIVQNLDKELQSLIEHEEQLVKETQKEKELRLQREQEEREQKEREKRERKAKRLENQEELTVEEWISWMEEKKKQGMTPEQQAEYERRKKAYLEKEREREAKRKKELEEKIKKTRDMMLAEQQAFSERDNEVKSSRMSDEELRRIQEENAKRLEQESQLRKERAKQKMEEMKQRELDEATPKARSALAARWEEQVKSRSGGKVSSTANKTTVMSDSLEREKQRMARIIPTSSQNGDESS